MVSSDSQNLSLGEAAGRFLAELSPEERETSQPEVYKFVRWYGWERPLAGLTAHEVANYAERLSLSDTDYVKKLELMRAFLVYAKKEGWSKANLATHLKTKKGKTGLRASVKRGLLEPVSLTSQGYTELEAEIAVLKDKRHQVIDEIRRAAADKDFRENAPLAAAREQCGHIEGRIRKLEETLKAATIIGIERQSTLKAGIGDKIVMCDMASGEEIHYMIVDSREVDPTQGRISNVSPIGKALIGRGEGAVVEVTVPAGKMRYQIKRIGR
ncbi:GreA/GreB family elongation factor [Chloroflexota bacterium]